MLYVYIIFEVSETLTELVAGSSSLFDPPSCSL